MVNSFQGGRIIKIILFKIFGHKIEILRIKTFYLTLTILLGWIS